MAEPGFEAELAQSPVDILRAALHFSREIAYPDLDISLYLERIDELAETVRGDVASESMPARQAERLSDFLFRRAGFRGNSDDYNDPRNSYLNEVLDHRLGIPISLSVIYMAVAQRLGMAAQGVGLPGHFIVCLPDSQGWLYIDPFHSGERLSEEACARLVEKTTGYKGQLQAEWLQPVSAHAILIRMLTNLRQVYVVRKDWQLALAVLEHLRMLQPDVPDLLRDMGLVCHHRGSLRQAVRYYEQYLLRAPQAADAAAIQKQMQAAMQTLARLN